MVTPRQIVEEERDRHGAVRYGHDGRGRLGLAGIRRVFSGTGLLLDAVTGREEPAMHGQGEVPVHLGLGKEHPEFPVWLLR